jgi:hypothetical protein
MKPKIQHEGGDKAKALREAQKRLAWIENVKRIKGYSQEEAEAVWNRIFNASLPDKEPASALQDFKDSIHKLAESITEDGKEPVKDKTDNEMIAEFMGFYITSDRKSVDGTSDRVWKSNDSPYFGGYRIPHLRFNESWDWLMPIVERIESLGFATKFRYEAFTKGSHSTAYHDIEIFSLNENNGYKRVAFCTERIPKIEAIYKAVVEFIKYYNIESTKDKEPVKCKHRYDGQSIDGIVYCHWCGLPKEEPVVPGMSDFKTSPAKTFKRTRVPNIKLPTRYNRELSDIILDYQCKCNAILKDKDLKIKDLQAEIRDWEKVAFGYQKDFERLQAEIKKLKEGQELWHKNYDEYVSRVRNATLTEAIQRIKAIPFSEYKSDLLSILEQLKTTP